MKIWVLFHQYSDGSGKATLLRAYVSETEARLDLEMVGVPHGTAEHHLEEVELVGERKVLAGDDF
jgi:hypothetical protein